MGNQCATFLSVYYWLFFGVDGVQQECKRYTPTMEIGDRVQTLNTFTPITGEIVDMYKNLVTIADDDAETVDQLLSFHADDLEVIS